MPAAKIKPFYDFVYMEVMHTPALFLKPQLQVTISAAPKSSHDENRFASQKRL
jgi:hypothetical protein